MFFVAVSNVDLQSGELQHRTDSSSWWISLIIEVESDAVEICPPS